MDESNSNFNKLYVMFSNDNIEYILGYNPRKIVEVDPTDPEYHKICDKLIEKKSYVQSNWLIENDTNFFWILNKNSDDAYLFKYYGNIDDLDFIENYEPISRKVFYSYYHFNGTDHRVITVDGYTEVQAILNYYSASSKELHHQNKSFIELKPGMFLFLKYVGKCIIYPDLETHDYQANLREFKQQPLNDDVFNFEKNIYKLSQCLKVNLTAVQKLTKEDLRTIASKSFDYNKIGSISELYIEYSSLIAKYLTDNYDGKIIMTNSELSFIDGKSVCNVRGLVNRTLEYIIYYEYNPAFYFNILFFEND